MSSAPLSYATMLSSPIAMPLLSADIVARHFSDSGCDRETLALFEASVAADGWAIDVDGVTSASPAEVQRYLDALSAVVQAAVPVLHRLPREFAPLLAHLTTMRCVYLARYVTQHNQQFLDSLAFLIETDGGKDPALAAIRRRFEAFSNVRLLGDIFSGKRLHRIQSIMGSYTDE